MPQRVIGYTIVAFALSQAPLARQSAAQAATSPSSPSARKSQLNVDTFLPSSVTQPETQPGPSPRNSQSPYRAVVFDCDGVLVDSEEDKFKAWQKVLAVYGYDLTAEQYKTMVGFDNTYMLKRVRAQAPHLSIPDSIIADKEAAFERLASQHVVAIEANVDFLKRLAVEKEVLGLKIGLASSACRSQIQRTIDALELTHVFDAVISGEDDLGHIADPVRNKPKPYIYEAIARMLKITSPQKILVFEDSRAGILAAHLAGMVTCALPNTWTQHQDFSEASYARENLGQGPVLLLLRQLSSCK